MKIGFDLTLYISERARLYRMAVEENVLARIVHHSLAFGHVAGKISVDPAIVKGKTVTAGDVSAGMQVEKGQGADLDS